MNIAINGFGRIGRVVARILIEQNMNLIAINDIHPIEDTKYLLQYDSTYGPLKETIIQKGKILQVGNQKIQITSEKDPKKLPWKKLNIDIVIEATGVFTDPNKAKAHNKAGAKHIIITAPTTNHKPDAFIIPTLTQTKLTKNTKTISIASCTTNCLAPLIAILEQNFKIEHALFTTTHAYTNSQALVDKPHKKLSRGRAAAVNIIPTTTGANKSIETLFPKLKGKIQGKAIRVPVHSGSLLDLTITLKKKPTIKQLNQTFQNAATIYPNIIQYTTDPIVSTDIQGNPHSCIIAADLTQNIQNTYKIFAWYDNEYAYSCRVVDAVKELEKLYN